MKNYLYAAHRNPDGSVCVRVEYKGKLWGALPLRLDLYNHSPTGFEWGYAGSGPAQLALALVAHATGKDRLALRIHQHYKGWTVSRLPVPGWRLGAVEIVASVRLLLHNLNHPPENPTVSENPAHDCNGEGGGDVSSI